MDWFKNIAVNLHAKGPAAVLISLIFAIAALGLWGQGDLAEIALSILGFAFGMLGLSLASKVN